MQLNFQPKASERIYELMRPYQRKLVGRIDSSWGNRKIATMATGAGKTMIALYLIARTIESGKRVLMLAHRIGLLGQLGKNAWEMLSVSSGYVCSGKPMNPHAYLQFSTTQSCTKLLKQDWLDEVGLVLVDECHISMSANAVKIIESFAADVDIVGLTATPVRTDKKQLGDIYHSIAKGPQTRWLIDNGFLSDFRHLVGSTVIDSSTLAITPTGDYDVSGMAREARKIVGNVVSKWQNLASDRLTVVFCPGVESAVETCQSFKDAGINAATIHSKQTVQERSRILKEFARGGIQVITNCSILIEGIDVPDITCVCMLRPTQSIAIWLQALGRGLRLGKGDSRELLILDFTDNLVRLGPVDEYREWELTTSDATQKKKKEPKEEKEREIKPREEYETFSDELIVYNQIDDWLREQLLHRNDYAAILGQYMRREPTVPGIQAIAARAEWPRQRTNAIIKGARL